MIICHTGKIFRDLVNPGKVHWDGWARINTETRNGGIIGVFRQGSKEKSRTVTVAGLDPAKKYSVLLAPDGKNIAQMTGKQLLLEGFNVSFTNSYDGNVFEIKMTD